MSVEWSTDSCDYPCDTVCIASDQAGGLADGRTDVGARRGGRLVLRREREARSANDYCLHLDSSGDGWPHAVAVVQRRHACVLVTELVGDVLEGDAGVREQ